MNKLKDTQDLLVKDDGFSDDLREALRRREARRKPTELPTDFVDSVIHEVNKGKARPKAKAWRIALTLLAAAACIAFAVMLIVPKSQPLPSLAEAGQGVEPVVPQPKPLLQSSLPQEPKMAAAPATHANMKFERRKRIVCTVQTHSLNGSNSPSAASKLNTPSAADSLNYYISKVEQSLTDIRDSCYQANVERLIRADAHLQRLVNQLILDGILADTIRFVAM